MKFLILLNNAPIAPLLKEVALELRRRQFSVVIATDSNYTKALLRLDTLGIPCFSFTDWLQDSRSDSEEQLGRDADEGGQWPLYADYDRSRYYGFGYLFSGGKTTATYSNLCAFFQNITADQSISDVFYENVSNGFSEAACEVIERVGGTYHGLTTSKLSGMATFSRYESDVRRAIAERLNDDQFTKVEIEWAREYIENLGATEPDYMKTNGLSDVGLWKRAIFKLPDLKNTALILRHSQRKHSALQFQFGRPIVSAMRSKLRLVMRRLRYKRVRQLYSDPPSGKCLFLYPLHYHPEASTSIHARYYDELNVIKNIAFSLRPDECLVVKDHMSAVAFESTSLYREIASLPSVTLLRPEVNAKEFVAKCEGVITLTSTLGYEAALLGKRVAVFGDTFYADHPLVEEIKSFHELRERLTHLRQPVEDGDSLKVAYDFVAAYRRVCFSITSDAEGPNRRSSKCNYVTDALIARSKGAQIGGIIGDS